jgi:hypothetical protein
MRIIYFCFMWAKFVWRKEFRPTRYLLNDHWIFNAGNYLGSTSAANFAMKSTGSKMTCMDALMPRAQDAQERPRGSCHHDTGF